jgi:hypothetical protein
MKKTNLIILGILVLLVTVLLVIRYTKRPTAEQVFRDFAVKDTASITKIFLADKQNRTVLLERRDNHWTANGEHKARRDLTNLLLETFARMEVSAPVPQAKMDYVLRSISSNSIKCEIYQNDKLSKTYYVGGVTEDNTGTYMIMENSSEPFVLHIPGFSGYLTVRYTADINEWRERIVFNYNVNDIHRVSVRYPGEIHESFIAIQKPGNNYELRTIDNKKVDFPFDTLLVKTFISKCKFLGFEAFIRDELNQHIIDSLSKEIPVAVFSVEDINGEINTMTTYYRQNIDQFVDDEGILYDYDLDRLYAVIREGKQAVLIQYYTLDPISYRLSYFKQ